MRLTSEPAHKPSGAAGDSPTDKTDPDHCKGAVDRISTRRLPWRRLLPFAKLLTSVGLITWILSTAELSSVWASLRGVNSTLLAIAFLSLPLGILLGTSRWKVLLRAQDVHGSFRYLYSSHLVAAFVKQFLPSTIGGDAIRSYDSWRAGASKSVALATVGVDRLLGLLVLALFAAGAVFFGPTVEGIWILRLLAVGLAVVLVVVVGSIFLPTPALPQFILKLWSLVPGFIQRPFNKLFGALDAFKGRRGALAAAFAFSILLQLNVIAFYWLIARSLGIELSVAQMFLVVPIATFLMMLPITINGVGVREGAWVGLLALYGVDKTSALALAWSEYGLMLIIGLIGGIVYAARR